MLSHLRRSKDDPHYFNSVVLRRGPYWCGQKEWSQAVVDYHTVAIETGNMLGKDYWVGGLIPWWLWTRPHSLVVVTGPSQTLLGSVTWKEVRRAVEGCPYWPTYLPAKITNGVKSSPQTMEIVPGWQALGFSTTSVERLSGQHAGELLVITEESSGVEDHIWEALDGLGASKVVAIGNPIRCDGGFVNLCDQGDADRKNNVPKYKAVCHLNIASTASPHAHLDTSPVGLASRGWIERMERKYGRTSLWFKSHVLAVRPAVSAETLIPESWLNFAAEVKRQGVPINHPIHATRRISCDLGEGVGRDATCVLVRDANGVLSLSVSASNGLGEAAQIIADMSRTWSVPHERISYDALGIGKNMPHHLAKHGITEAQPYAGHGKPFDSQFTNLRTEAAWKLRQRLDPQFAPDSTSPNRTQLPFSIPPADWWPRMFDELKALSYSLVGRKTKLITKEDWCARLGHSPDLADALIQSFALE